MLFQVMHSMLKMIVPSLVTIMLKPMVSSLLLNALNTIPWTR